MLDITLLRKQPEEVRKGIAAKNGDPKLVDRFLELDARWRALTKEAEEMRAEQKKLGEAKKIDEAKALKEKAEAKSEELKRTEKEREEALRRMPNLPLADVPRGKSAEENIVLREVGVKTEFDFKPKEYLEIGERLGIIDVKHAAKSSGTRFGALEEEAVLLEFALVRLAFDALVKEGFTPIIPPVLVGAKMMQGMGFVDAPKDAEEAYYIEKDDLFLVGTSEQSVIPLHAGHSFSAKDLPHRHVAFSTCFRREAGSHGKDTKGILRVHQFDKVEMLSITAPEDSEKEHQFLLSVSEKLMQALNIPYRVVALCGGDLSRPSAKTYDIEAWLPGSGQYRETHSVSNTTDFQARRLGIKYGSERGTGFAHVLNGTAFAIGRALIAILENYQQKDGSVKIPDALQSQMSGMKEIKRASK
ncbi:serine--tRNA ligase [Candidatus Azambacteria bacterium]|nr:serine--tRNA ligase [Candidatus Azambacteria bacterium]